MREKGKSELLAYLLNAPTIAMLLFIGIFPLLYCSYFSFFDYRIITQSATFVGAGNYVSAFQDPVFLSSLKVTGTYVLVALPLELTLGFILALILNQKTRGSSIIRVVFMIPLMVAPLVAGYLWRFMYWPDLGLVDTIINRFGIRTPEWVANPQTALPSLIVVDVWQWTPFVFLILLAGLQALPKEPYEAALIDGASRLQVFRYITLPMMKTIIAVAILFRFTDLIKIFDQPLIITNGGPGFSTYTASLYIYRVGLSEQFRVGYAAALSWILNIITMVAVMIFIRRTFVSEEKRPA
jgi:multiple sugar transport system permease protein